MEGDGVLSAHQGKQVVIRMIMTVIVVKVIIVMKQLIVYMVSQGEKRGREQVKRITVYIMLPGEP